MVITMLIDVKKNQWRKVISTKQELKGTLKNNLKNSGYLQNPLTAALITVSGAHST